MHAICCFDQIYVVTSIAINLPKKYYPLFSCQFGWCVGCVEYFWFAQDLWLCKLIGEKFCTRLNLQSFIFPLFDW